MRERDLSFEKLAEVCGIEIAQLHTQTRGALNRALGLIRETNPDLSDVELALVIESKAKGYHKLWPGTTLTPTALAKHWAGIEGMLEQQAAPVTYTSGDRTICTTCESTGLVHAGLRPPQLTQWIVESFAKQKKLVPAHLVDRSQYDPERKGADVYRPCPDCNQEALQSVSDYLSRFNRLYSGGPRLPVPSGVQLFSPNTEESA
jgi:hypothetical protein